MERGFVTYRIKSHEYRAIKRALSVVLAENSTVDINVIVLRTVTKAQLRARNDYPITTVVAMFKYTEKLVRKHFFMSEV